MRPPDLEVDEDSRHNPGEHDRGVKSPEDVQVVDQDVPRNVGVLGEYLQWNETVEILQSFVVMLNGCQHKKCSENQGVDYEPGNILGQSVWHIVV